MVLDGLAVPIVLAPLAGGPTTPELAAAVSNAGGLGFLAAGYLSDAALADQIARARALTSAPLGVNLFVPGRPAPADAVSGYAATLSATASEAGAELGEPRFDDDQWAAKLARLTADPLPVISFTFGCPERAVIDAVHAAGSEAWVTVTSPADALVAVAAGSDVLVLQGNEAGGHRSSFTDDPADDASGGYGLLSLIQLVRNRTALPLVAAGGITTGAGVAAVLAAGATAAQLGTAFLRCPEAGTSAVQRAAVATATPTAMTRAFTGRLARGIRNRFMAEHDRDAPVAYPEVHYLTGPLRAAGRAAGNPDLVNLWAGQTHELTRELPAGQLVAVLAQEARTALATLQAKFFRAERGALSSMNVEDSRPSGDLFSVAGKVAVVTGGSRGIGKMIAGGLVRAGCRVYITARKAAACDATAAELSAFGECISVPLDLAIAGGVEALVRTVSEREDRLHILVNNAGATWGAPLEEYPLSAFDKLWSVNIKALFALTVACLPLLRAAASAADPARVINIGSIDGLGVPAMESYAYSTTKAGVHMLTRHLASTLSAESITVNAIAPGPFDSKMMAFALDDPEMRAAIAAGVPLGRVGEPDDMAGAAIFLASRAGRYLTGAVIPVDGGLSTIRR